MKMQILHLAETTSIAREVKQENADRHFIPLEKLDTARLEDMSIASPDCEAIRHEYVSLVTSQMQSLSRGERRVLTLLFGLDGDEPLTRQQVSKQLAISVERVRQIEKKAFGRLREGLQWLKTEEIESAGGDIFEQLQGELQRQLKLICGQDQRRGMRKDQHQLLQRFLKSLQ